AEAQWQSEHPARIPLRGQRRTGSPRGGALPASRLTSRAAARDTWIGAHETSVPAAGQVAVGVASIVSPRETGQAGRFVALKGCVPICCVGCAVRTGPCGGSLVRAAHPAKRV